MQLDVRLPMGWLFATLGVILTIFGFISDKAIYAKSGNSNVNITWGIVFLVFGGICLFLAKRKKGDPS